MKANGMPRILVVDGERDVADIVVTYLSDDGYSVVRAYDGEQGLRLARETEPHLIVLDPDLARRNGIDAFRAIRTLSDVPIIVVSARTSETDLVVALELGADDYVAKPFSPRELVARVRSVLRRAHCGTCGAVRSDRPRAAGAQLEIDRTSFQAWRNGHRVALTPTEFRILEVLAAHPGQILTRAQLLDCIASEADVFDRTLDKHIANLRKKIEDDPSRPRYVVTVFGVGYKYSA
jgi:DNA-binding response OmpR family regulator